MAKKRSISQINRKDSLSYYVMLLAHLPDAVIATDTNFAIASWNKAAEKIYGWKATEAKGKIARTFLKTEFINKKENVSTMIRKNGHWEGEVIQAKKNGTKIHIFSTTMLMRDENGIIIGSFSINRDITRQKKAEEDQRRLAAIVTSSADAIVSKNLNSIITSWNIAAETMFGYKASEIVGQPIYLIIPNELRDEEKKIIARIKKGKKIEHYQTIRMRKDKRKFPVSITVSPIRDDNGTIIGASKIARDITQQKQFEDNLAFLSNASKLLSSSLDYNTTLQEVAKIAIPHIADWCGVDIVDAQGELRQVAVAHKDPKKVAWAKAYRKANPPKMSDTSGVPGVIKAGKSVLYPVITDELLVASAKNEEDLRLARGLNLSSVMIIPITVNKKTTGAISFVATEIGRQYTKSDLSIAEELAARASLAIENAILYDQAQKELEQRKKLEKQKDEFIGVASHELKTPVTSIKSYAQVLQYRFAKEGNQSAADLLGKLDGQVDKLTNLIGDLLDVTKIDSGHMQLNQENFSFDELVDELIEELQRTTEKHVLTKQGKTGKTIFADRDRLGQVITNLVTNAIKYSPYSKEIIIHLSAQKGNVKLCVEDFGIGIEKDKQDRVFERFFRASGPMQDTYPGLGLGLYVSNEIIKRLRGRIWVESVAGKGSTFCFELPIK